MLIVAGPVNGKESGIIAGEIVQIVVGSADCFETVHDAAGRLASLDEKGKCEHGFNNKEKVIDGINGTDFEGLVSIGDVVSSE